MYHRGAQISLAATRARLASRLAVSSRITVRPELACSRNVLVLAVVRPGIEEYVPIREGRRPRVEYAEMFSMDVAVKSLLNHVTAQAAALAVGDLDTVAVEAGKVIARVASIRQSPKNHREHSVPFGWSTALDYVMEKDPVVGLGMDLDSYFAVDEPALCELAIQQGRAIVSVPAPIALSDAGRSSCLAFPRVVLEEFYQF